jgi:hypothetical protein
LGVEKEVGVGPVMTSAGLRLSCSVHALLVRLARARLEEFRLVTSKSVRASLRSNYCRCLVPCSSSTNYWHRSPQPPAPPIHHARLHPNHMHSSDAPHSISIHDDRQHQRWSTDMHYSDSSSLHWADVEILKNSCIRRECIQQGMAVESRCKIIFEEGEGQFGAA